MESLLPENRIRQCWTNRISPPFIANPLAIQHFRRLHRSRVAFASDLEQQTRLLELLEALDNLPADQGDPLPSSRKEVGAIRLVKQYVDAHYLEEITLAQLAQITGLNGAYLCRAFTREVGMPPHAYQIAVRIDRSRALLRMGVPAGHAAQQIGFYDQSHFTRHFRRLIQMSPTQYARQVKNVQVISLR